MNEPGVPGPGVTPGPLTVSGVASSWYEQLRRWFDDACATPGIVDPNAIQLATASADGQPSVRTVLVKTLDERGLVFFTNYESAKAAELAANPRASAIFAWLALSRQVRVSGLVERVSRAETEAYFASRPRGSQLGAWASPQSQVVASRSSLEALVDSVAARFGDGPVPAPPHWGGFLLRPEIVEFWQGRADRLHDRIRFRSDGPGWVVERLAP